MLFLLYEWLKDTGAGRILNFLRYPTFRIIAAGVFATVAILALVGERIIKTLEEIRDGSVTRIRVNTPADRAVTERVVTEREAEQLAASR